MRRWSRSPEQHSSAGLPSVGLGEPRSPPAGAVPGGWSSGSSAGLSLRIARAPSALSCRARGREAAPGREDALRKDAMLPGASIKLLPPPLLGRSLGASSGSSPSRSQDTPPLPSYPDSLERGKSPSPGRLRSQLASATRCLSWRRTSRNSAAMRTAASPPPTCPWNYRFVSFGPQRRAQSKAATPLWHRWLSVPAAQALLLEEAEEHLPSTRDPPEVSVRACQDGKSKRFLFSDSAFSLHLKRLLW